MAFSDGRLDSTEMGWSHVVGQPSPYESYNVTMNSISVEEFTTGIPYTFKFKPEYILHSHRNPLHSIQLIEPENGINVTLLPGQEVVLSMIDTGSFYLTLKANFLNASPHINKQKIKVNGPAQPRGVCDKIKIYVESDIPFKGPDESIGTTSLSDTYIYYHYNENGECENFIKKPIIICDGYDPYDRRSIKQIEEEFYFHTENGLVKSIEELRKQGFDVIIMNFPIMGWFAVDLKKMVLNENGDSTNVFFRDGGSDYTQRNAMLMVKLIQMVNDSLQENNSDEELCIIGPSMGGQITRYALAYMEAENENGVPDMDHNTRVWISFDSPHLGANIPLANTGLIYTLGYEFNQEDAQRKYKYEINTPAAQQYLVNQIAGKEYRQFTYQNSWAPSRKDYIRDLKNNGLVGSDGWPQNVKRVAIANSSDTGEQTGVAGEEALYIRGGIFWGRIKAAVFQTFIQKEERQTNIPLIYAYAKNIGNPPYEDSKDIENYNYAGSVDILPGSVTNSTEEVFNGIIESLNEKKAVRITDTRLKPKHTFIPTISALALKYSEIADWSQDLTDRDLVCTGEIPFHSYYISGINQDHITITQDIFEYIKDQVLYGKLGCLPVCKDFTLTGIDEICDENMNTIHTFTFTGTIDSGQTLSWEVSGDLSMESNNGQSIDIKITSPIGYGEVSAIVSNDCGDIITKTIEVEIGKPAISLSASLNDNTCIFTVTQNSIPSGITPIKYEWSRNGTTYTKGGQSLIVFIPPHHGSETIYARAQWACGGYSYANIYISLDAYPGCSDPLVISENSDNDRATYGVISEENNILYKKDREDRWQLRPNPTNAIWNIDIPANASGTYEVILYDINGIEIERTEFSASHYNIGIGKQNLRKGLYFIHILDNNTIIILKGIKF